MNVAETNRIHQKVSQAFSGAMPPNPQDLSLKTKPVGLAWQKNPEGSENRNVHRLRPLDARVASQHCPILPVTGNSLHGYKWNLGESLFSDIFKEEIG